MAGDLLQTLTPKQLLQLTGEVIEKLLSLGIARTRNNPLADYTEWLVATSFGWERAEPSVKGHDATDKRTNTRYEIKGRRLTPRNKSRQLSAIRDIDGHHFDFLIAVIYDQNFNIIRALKIPHAVVQAMGTHSEHTNSLILHARDELRLSNGVEDITNDLSEKASRITG